MVSPTCRAVTGTRERGGLLSAGANPLLQNARGSTALDLALWTTGRGGAGSAAAKAEQRIILKLLEGNTR
jgi:hypothetical protein